MKKGRVARSVGANRGGGHGLLVIPELPGIRALFNADTSCADNAQPSSLEVDDEVAFRLMDHLRIDVKTAKDLQLLCKGSDRRELGQVISWTLAVPLSQFRLGQALPARAYCHFNPRLAPPVRGIVISNCRRHFDVKGKW